MTRSKVSPDGKIAQRDVGAKLVVIMVGLPARGKSYITKKIQRYLSWQQHETKIFNVGNRRRVAAGTSSGPATTISSPPRSPRKSTKAIRTGSISGIIDAPTQAAHILLNGVDPTIHEDGEDGHEDGDHGVEALPPAGTMPQSAEFFSPSNSKASAIREQVAMSTLDELLDFLLNQGGSVGILDATNSTIARRQVLFNHIKAREPKLGILFVESVCEDQKVSFVSSLSL
jgi:6-phosphofructo-2-kinase